MMLPPARRLGRYVEPRVSEDRVDRVWAAVASRKARSWAAWRTPAMAAAAAFAAAAVIAALIGHVRRGAPSLAGGIVVESGDAHVLTLPDGSTVALRRNARVRCDTLAEDRVDTTLERGTARFDVRHASGRVFVVHAGPVDVVDRGTRFVVARDGDRVRVGVEVGSVSIERPGTGQAPRILAAGESWTNAPPDQSAQAVPAAAAPRPVQEEPVAATGTGSSADPAPAASSPPKRTAPASAPTPRELLEAANTARLAGRPRDAAAAFDTLRRRYRSDPRAGLAAFELGRLRLDALADPSAAVEAFDDAISLAPAAPFREDAEARRVEALDRAHDPRCAAAKQAYLARYPDGLHAAAVAARCAP